jgi:hypothetical protein
VRFSTSLSSLSNDTDARKCCNRSYAFPLRHQGVRVLVRRLQRGALSLFLLPSFSPLLLFILPSSPDLSLHRTFHHNAVLRHGQPAQAPREEEAPPLWSQAQAVVKPGASPVYLLTLLLSRSASLPPPLLRRTPPTSPRSSSFPSPVCSLYMHFSHRPVSTFSLLSSSSHSTPFSPLVDTKPEATFFPLATFSRGHRKRHSGSLYARRCTAERTKRRRRLEIVHLEGRKISIEREREGKESERTHLESPALRRHFEKTFSARPRVSRRNSACQCRSCNERKRKVRKGKTSSTSSWHCAVKDGFEGCAERETYADQERKGSGKVESLAEGGRREKATAMIQPNEGRRGRRSRGR